MKKENDKVMTNMKKNIKQVKSSTSKAKEIIRKSGIYTRSGNLKSSYS